MALEKTIEINVDSKQAEKNLKSINVTIDEQREILVLLEEEYAKAKQALDKYNESGRVNLAQEKQLKGQLTERKDALTDQRLGLKKLSVEQRAATQVVNNFKEAQKDNTNIIRGIDKLTGGYATKVIKLKKGFLSGLKGVKSFTLGLSGFKKAMIATGIGAFVILVGALVANWDKVKDALSGASKESKAYKEAQDDIVSAVSKVQKSITEMDNVFEQAKKGTISKDEALKQYNDSLGESVGYATSLSQAEGLLVSNASIVIESTKLKAQAEVLYAKAAEARAKVIAGDESLDPNFWQKIKVSIASVGGISSQAIATNVQYAKNVNESLNTAKKLESSAADIQTKISKLQEGLIKGSVNPKKIRSTNKKIKNLEDEKAKQDEERIKKLDELKSKIRDESANTEDEARALELQKIREHNLTLLQEAKDAGLKSQELENSLDEKLAAKQAEFDKIDEERKKKKDAEDAASRLKQQEEKISELELKKELEEITFQEQRDLIKEREALLLEDTTLTTEQKLALEKSYSDASVDIAKKESDAKKQALDGYAAALSTISGVIGQETEAGKAIAIASSLVNTYAAITGQLAVFSTKGAPPIPGYAIAQAIATGVVGLANVKKIASVKIPNSKGGGGGAGAGSLPSAGAASAPPAFNVVGASGSSQLADAIGGQSQQPVQAFVVANDVTTAQSLQNNIVEGATIG